MNRLFADIETSLCDARVWRPGYKVNVTYENIKRDASIVCACWKWEGQKKVHGAAWDWSPENWNDKPVLDAFFGALESADELIAHNGDKFDWPWIRTRCLVHKIVLPPIRTVDTLRIARSLFNFPSNRQDHILKYLKIGRKLPTNYELWDKVCDGEKKALNYMVKYCKEDVRGLEAMWKEMEPYFPAQTHVGVLHGKERWTCPRDGSRNVHLKETRYLAASISTPMGMKRFKMQCKDCGGYYTLAENVFKLYKEFKEDEKERKRKCR